MNLTLEFLYIKDKKPDENKTVLYYSYYDKEFHVGWTEENGYKLWWIYGQFEYLPIDERDYWAYLPDKMNKEGQIIENWK